jgi:hypothetical protein
LGHVTPLLAFPRPGVVADAPAIAYMAANQIEKTWNGLKISDRVLR